MFHQRAESPLRLDGTVAAERFFASCLAASDPSREHLWVAHLDGQARCLLLTRHDGGEGSATLPVRQIIADAARHGSSGVIVAHNHPSGDSSPSAADLAATRLLARAADAIDVTVVDHLVMADGRASSMRALGLL